MKSFDYYPTTTNKNSDNNNNNNSNTKIISDASRTKKRTKAESRCIPWRSQNY